MWLFLATEVMFFGGLLTAFAVYRTTSPREVALASRHLNVWLGCLNTVVLLTSSLTMALAVRAAQLRQHRRAGRSGWLLTMVLGAAFLGIKAIEYTEDYHEHLIPGWNFQVPEEDRAAGRARSTRPATDGDVLRPLLLHDGPARHPPDHRHRPGRRDGVSLVDHSWFSGGGATQIEVTGLVLALRRRRLGVPLSVALSDRRSPMKQHVASVRTNVVIFVALAGPLAGDGRGGLSAAGTAAFPARDDDRHGQGRPDRPVLHACSVQPSAHAGHLPSRRCLWLAIMIALTLSDYHSRGWLDIPGK